MYMWAVIIIKMVSVIKQENSGTSFLFCYEIVFFY